MKNLILIILFTRSLVVANFTITRKFFIKAKAMELAVAKFSTTNLTPESE